MTIYNALIIEVVSLISIEGSTSGTGKTRYARKAVLDHMLGRSEYLFPANVWAALFSGDPSADGLLASEIALGGYARIGISSLMGDASLATGEITNTANIDFGPATEDWPNILFIGIMDSPTIGIGNMIYFGTAGVPRFVTNTSTLRIIVGGLIVEEN